MKKKFEIITKYFLSVLTCLVIVSIFLALYGFFQITILGHSYANYFGYSLFEVESGSMAPTIDVKDMVVVKLTKNIKENDIITYRIEDSFVTHRVVKIQENKVVTKGDYNNFEDKIIPKKSIIGKVVKVFPKFGVWKKMLLSPIVIIMVFFTMLLFSIGFSYEDKKKAKKKSLVLKVINKIKNTKKDKNLEQINKKPEELKTETKEITEKDNSSRAKTKICGEIKWEDCNNQDGIRASSVTVKVLENNNLIADKEVTENSDWKFEFNDLYKYKEGHENEEEYEIKYTIDENMVDRYSKTVSDNVITNTHNPQKINISGEIKWEDENENSRPQVVKISLLKNGTVLSTKNVTCKNNWKYTFAGVYKYDNGVEIKYTVDEEAPASYRKSISNYDIMNKYLDEEE